MARAVTAKGQPVRVRLSKPTELYVDAGQPWRWRCMERRDWILMYGSLRKRSRTGGSIDRLPAASDHLT